MDNYKILGIKKNASKDEIVKAYKMHYLRYKSLGSNITPEQEEEFRKIENAYNELMGYNVHIEDLSVKKQHPFFKFIGIDQDKFENFWMYNKTKILVALFILVMIYFYISQLASRPNYDIYVAFTGTFKMTDDPNKPEFDSDLLMTDMISRFDFIKEPLMNYFWIDIYAGKPQTGAKQANQQKFVIELSGGVIDFMVLDGSTFDYYSEKGFLMDLKDYVNEYSISPDLYRTGTFIDSNGNKHESIYGIDISNTAFIRDNKIESEDGQIIACITVNTKKANTAKKLLKAITQQEPASGN